MTWVASCSHTQWHFLNHPQFAEGSEHLVFLANSGLSVWKATRTNVFGDSYYFVNEVVHQRNNSPREYLVRLRLWRSLFQSAPRALGISDLGQIITTHDYVAGAKPSQDGVNEFLALAGLTPRKLSRWLSKKRTANFEIWVGDARADNFVESAAGIVPIDLRLWMTAPE